MKQIIRNILAIVIGLAIGAWVNMFIVMKGSLPAGVNMQNLADSMHLFEAKHFVFPILGHALGTFVGALFAGIIAATYKFRFAMAIGFFFLAGGIANVFMLHFPLVPAIIDLSLAYIPMGILAGKISTLKKLSI